MTLLEIKEALIKFEVVQCGMYHEKVAIDQDTLLPIKVNNGIEEIYQRVNLCNAELRRWRLGCAHTSANDHFLNLICTIPNQNQTVEQIQQSYHILIGKICELDHQKGNLEKYYAQSLETNSALEAQKIKVQIAEVITQHREYMKDFQNLQFKTIAHIEKLLKDQSFAN